MIKIGHNNQARALPRPAVWPLLVSLVGLLCLRRRRAFQWVIKFN